jgi:hypothetical protein
MPRNSDGSPRSPQVDFLEKMVERLDKVINEGNSLAVVHDEDQSILVDEIIEEPVLVAWRDAFDWLATFLGNRRDYHKRRQTKTKVEMDLMRRALEERGIDVKKLEKEADDAADDSIS